MKVSKQFLRDFAYIANFYEWTAADIEDVKAQTRESAELRAYWTSLAEAHRAGYKQTEKNGYIRLGAWRTDCADMDSRVSPDTAFSEQYARAREAQAHHLKAGGGP